ncbi:hypothetical protein AUP40_10695 [Thalassospira xiamenensis]|uniref:Uncharacterized protein n=1 Tax=Thalassospira xiamenensis TaxID=220697 RepID=A0ABR5Y6A3_9PROT|nr:hypothetical protein AUP40_10695 [Thalassospira xiamenensis]
MLVRGSENRDEVGSVQFSPVRSLKRDNAENQRARIAPGLDRHGIGTGSSGRDWLAGSVASGPMVRSEMPKGR